MSRNGSGTYSLPAGNPVVTNTTISSTWANTTLADIATALTGSLAADGQTTATGNLQMGNNKIVNLDDGTNPADAVNYGQLLAAVGGTGKIIQTVQTFGSVAYSTSGTYSATGHTATITPTSNTSKILVILGSSFWQTNGFGGNSFLALYRNGANLIASNDWIVMGTASANIYSSVSFHYLDSPATTSAVIYQPYIRADNGGTTAYNGTGTAVLTLLEITA
jgi:hypothetical protein